MMGDSPGEHEGAGEGQAGEGSIPPEFVTRVYRELRALAVRRLRGERRSHTLQPTDLVHEVFLRLQRSPVPESLERVRFLALCGRLMRNILVEHARRRAASKRGGRLLRVTLDEAIDDGGGDAVVDVLALDRALIRLAEVDPEAADVVELSFFGGLTQVEVGELRGRSERWVRGQWAFARAWLRRELEAHSE